MFITEIVASPNSRAICRRCRSKIEKGEARAGREELGFAGEPTLAFFHASCAVDVALDEVARYLRGNPGLEFVGRAEIEATVASRMRAIEEAKKEPAQRDRSALSVEQAKDPSGRPRVRVYLAGSAFSMGNGPAIDLDRYCRERTFCSPLREYQFILQYTGEPEIAEDPSQPVIGAVFAPYADAKAMPNQRTKVAAWRSQGLPTPLLWVFVRGNTTAPKDEQIQRWRAFLDEAGFSGDDATVLSARKADEAALTALVAALDERFPFRRSDDAGEALPADQAFAKKLTALVAAENDAAVMHAMASAHAALRSTANRREIPAYQRQSLEGMTSVSPDARRAFGHAASRALSFDSCVEHALGVLEHTPEIDPSAQVCAAIARFVKAPKGKLPRPFEALVAFARDRKIEGRGAPIFDALIVASNGPRLLALAEALFSVRDARSDRALVPWIEGLDDRDPRKSALDSVRTRTRQRIARTARSER